MAYRDDLDAAQARAAAAEREAEALRDKLEMVVAGKRPLVPRPPRYVVDERDGSFSVSWRAFGLRTVLPLVILSALAVIFGAQHGVAWLALLPGYFLLAALVDRNVVRLSPDGLVARRGPLPLPGGKRLARGEVAQLYVEENERGTFALRALDRRGRKLTLVTGELDADGPRWLEHELEQRLGLAVQPVEGEL